MILITIVFADSLNEPPPSQKGKRVTFRWIRSNKFRKKSELFSISVYSTVKNKGKMFAFSEFYGIGSNTKAVGPHNDPTN